MFHYGKWKLRLGNRSLEKSVLIFCTHVYTRDVVYVRTVADLMIKAKVNAYIMYIFGTIELSSLHATKNYFQMHNINVFQEAKTYLYIGHWKHGRLLI